MLKQSSLKIIADADTPLGAPHQARLKTVEDAPSPAPRGRGRPRKADGARDETRERLIRAGIDILSEQCFASTSLDEILKSCDVPKGSFYYYFSSKNAFGCEVVRQYGVLYAQYLNRFLHNTALSPLQRLKMFIAANKDAIAHHDYKRGCLLGNIGQELGAWDADFRAMVDDAMGDWEGHIENCLIAAQEAGEVPEGADLKGLAAFFWIGWEGAVFRSKLLRDTKPIDLFANAFFKALGAPSQDAA